MNRPEKCPRCAASELFESCGSTFPFRITSCRCGWDNLDETIHAERAQTLGMLLTARTEGTIPLGFTSKEMELGLRNLQDPEQEASFIAAIRNPCK